MILFVCYGDHIYTHNRILDEIKGCKLGVCNYNWLLKQKNPPKGSYVFLDRERMGPWELRIASALYQHIKNAGPAYRAINNPALMADRQSLLRLLHVHGINDFNAYSVTERQMPQKYPVFIRRDYDHHYPVSDLISNEIELLRTLEKLKAKGEPEAGLLIVEYCAQPLSGGLFRKLSSYRVANELFFFNTVHENSWLVKYGTKNSANDALYTEEQEMIKSNAFKDELTKVFDLAGIEYGRVDFGLVNGQCQIYEINTNPTLYPPKEHPNSIRNQNQILGWEKYKDAIRALVTTDPDGPQTGAFEHKDLVLDTKSWSGYGIPVVR
ncbi:MAG: hypothetical protein V7744_20035 [Pseudomonadales bacterium]